MNIEEYDKEAMEDIGIITDILNQKSLSVTDDDIEKRLRDFHQEHNNKKPHLPSMVIKVCLGAAAAIALLLVMVGPSLQKETTVELNTTDNGLVASRQKAAGSSAKCIATAVDEATGEQQVESKDLDRLFDHVDTIRLNVSKGHSCKMVLPDGSLAYLHPDTRLMYAKGFDGPERRVTLDGEAYFVVKKDKQHPFIVATASSETLVTGTEFNVKASEKSDATVKVTLVRGCVQFSTRQGQDKVTLSPGKEALLRASRPIQVHEADTMEYVAWRDGYFYFDNASLQDILVQISKSYGVKTVITDAKLTQYRMHFMLQRDLTLDEVIDNLNRMKKVRASVVNGKLYIEQR